MMILRFVYVLMYPKVFVFVILHSLILLTVKAQTVDSYRRYEDAYDEMSNMLDEKTPLSIKRAVFLAEWAYLDGNLEYEKDFCEPILKDVAYMKRWMAANNLSQYNRQYKTKRYNHKIEPI